MKQSYNFLLSVLILLMLSLPLSAVNIKLLKGTVLSDMDPAYAPFWGLTMWEEGIAKQFYNLSAKKMKAKIEKSLDEIQPADLTAHQVTDKAEVLKILSDRQNSKTEDLVAQMFHESGGTFTVTNALNNPVRQLTPEHIGNILKMISNYQTQKDYNPSVKGIKPITNEEFLTKSIQQYLVSLKLTRPSSVPGSLDMKEFPAGELLPFAKALVGAVQECASSNPDKIYPENTAQSIVLGYMLVKSNTRQDLQDYLSAFTGKEVILSKQEYTAQDFQEILKQNPDLTNIEEFSDFMCVAVYEQKYASPLPKIVPNNSVKYQDKPFADCVETTIRNLCNIATYSVKDQKLGKTPEGIEMSQGLQKFYRQDLSANPAEIGNVLVHQSWTSLVENMPGMLYGNLLVSGTQNSLNVKSMCDGVIPVDKVDVTLPVKLVSIAGKDYQVQEKKVGSKTYWLVSKESGLLCYELTTSVLDIIVALNNLFDLKLYSSADVVLQPNFAQKYFAKMCEKLHWSISDDQIQKVIDLEKDALGSVEISVSSADGSEFKINLTTKMHSYISVNGAASSRIPYIAKGEFVAKADGMTQAAYVSLNLLESRLYEHLKPGSLLYLPVANSDDRMNLIQDLMKDEKTMKVHESYLVKLIMSMGDLADAHYQNDVLKMIEDFKTVSKPIAQALVIMTSIAHVKYNYSEIMVLYSRILLNDGDRQSNINKLFEDLHDDFSNKSFDLIDSLIAKTLIKSDVMSPVLKSIDVGMQNENFRVRQKNLALISRVINQDLITSDNLKKALQWVEIGMKSSGMQDTALSVLHKLIKKNLITSDSLKETFQWIDEGMKSNNEYLIAIAFGLVDSLLATGLIKSDDVSIVLSWINIIMKNSFIDKGKKEALKVIDSLIKKGLLKSDNVRIVLQWIVGSLNDAPAHVLTIFEALLATGLIKLDDVNIAMSIIEFDLMTNNFDTKAQENALLIVDVLVEKNLITSERADSLLTVLSSMDVNVENIKAQVIKLQLKLSKLSKSEPTIEPKLEPTVEPTIESKPEDFHDWIIVDKPDASKVPTEQPKSLKWTERVSNAWRSLRGIPKTNNEQQKQERLQHQAEINRVQQRENITTEDFGGGDASAVR